MQSQPSGGNSHLQAAAPGPRSKPTPCLPLRRPIGGNRAALARGLRRVERGEARPQLEVTWCSGQPPRPSAAAPPPPRPFPGGTLGAAPNCAGCSGVSVREGRALHRAGRAWAGVRAGGMLSRGQGDKMAEGYALNTPSPHLGVGAEKGREHCWGRGAAATREGPGVL